MSTTSTVQIFIVNLKRSSDRRKYMEALMQTLGLEYEFIEGIDGSQLSRKEIDDIHHKAQVYPSKDKFNLVPGEIGCAMSHIKCYERIVTEKINHCIILEDDIYFIYPDAFLAFIRNINTFQNYDLILLNLIDKFINAKESLLNKIITNNVLQFGEKQIIPQTDKQFEIGSPTSFPYSTAGYYLSLKGAIKILKHAYPIRMVADMLTGNAKQYNLNIGVPNRLIMKQQMKLETTVNNRPKITSPAGKKIEYLLSRNSKIFKLLRYCKRLVIVYLTKFHIISYEKYDI